MSSEGEELVKGDKFYDFFLYIIVSRVKLLALLNLV